MRRHFGFAIVKIPPAAAPAFVNSGSNANGGGSPSIAIPLPASRTNGNLLIAFCEVSASGKSLSVSSGWTLGGNENFLSFSWAWRYVDGTETNCTFTNTGGTNITCNGQMLQFSGVRAGGPIGNISSTSANSVNMALGGLVTANPNSLVLGLLGHGGSSVPPLPTNYTNLVSNLNATQSYRAVDEVVATAGNQSDDISLTTPSNQWAIFLIELRAN